MPNNTACSAALFGTSIMLAVTSCGVDVPRPNAEPGSTNASDALVRSPSPSENDLALVGTSWTLVSLDCESPMEDTEITLEFQAQQLKGTSGCNFYGGGPDSGAYSALNGRFSMKMMAVTVRLCLEPGGIMDQEERYLAAFGSIDAYQVTISELRLIDSRDEVRLVYVPATP